jgi:hypothetical protein
MNYILIKCVYIRVDIQIRSRGRLVYYLLSRIRDFGDFPVLEGRCLMLNVRKCTQWPKCLSQNLYDLRKDGVLSIKCRVSLPLHRLFDTCFTAIYKSRMRGLHD